MTRFKGKYRTETDRWRSWDYTSQAWYFITICTKGHDLLFGRVRDDHVSLSPLGKVAMDNWVQINPRVPDVHVDEFMIMPNHLHGILIIASLGNDHPDRKGTLPAESTVETLHATSLRVNSNALSISKRMSHISPKSGSL